MAQVIERNVWRQKWDSLDRGMCGTLLQMAGKGEEQLLHLGQDRELFK